MNFPFESDPSSSTECQAGLMQVLREGGEEVMGRQAVTDLFERAERCTGNSTLFSALHAELKDSYGSLGGQGVAVRLGRASFKYGLRKWGDQAGMNSAAFRLQPSVRRTRASLKKMADLLRAQFGSHVDLSEDETHWFWRVAQCPACCARSSALPDCHLLAGMLQETLAWAGGGRFYRVVETECSAAGGPVCLFRIDKKPLD